MKKHAEYQCSTTSLQLVIKLNHNQSLCHTQILQLLVTTPNHHRSRCPTQIQPIQQSFHSYSSEK